MYVGMNIQLIEYYCLLLGAVVLQAKCLGRSSRGIKHDLNTYLK